MANELVGVDAWLYSRLTGDATLAAIVGTRVYADVGEQGAAYPLVIFNLQASSDVFGVGAQRVFTRPVYQVKVVGQGSGYAALQAAANRVDALLHVVSTPEAVSIGGVSYQVHGSHRESQIHYVEIAGGVKYYHMGGLYRIFIS